MCEHVRASRIITRPRAVCSSSGVRSNDLLRVVLNQIIIGRRYRGPTKSFTSVTEVPVTERKSKLMRPIFGDNAFIFRSRHMPVVQSQVSSLVERAHVMLTKRRAATFRVNSGKKKRARARARYERRIKCTRTFSCVQTCICERPRRSLRSLAPLATVEIRVQFTLGSFGGARFPVQVAHVDAFPRSRAGAAPRRAVPFNHTHHTSGNW